MFASGALGSGNEILWIRPQGDPGLGFCRLRSALLALVHIVTCHVANDENNPEEDVSSDHFNCDADFPCAQLIVNPGERNRASLPKGGEVQGT